MSKGVNKVILIGNLGNDPDSRSFPDGSMVTAISVATSESWKDKNTGQQQEKTEWCRVVLRDRGNYKLGQIAAQYLRKGSKVYIEGKLQTRKWTDQHGVDRYTTEIIAENLQMLDAKQDDQQQTQGQMPQQQSGYQQTPRQQPAPQYQPKANYKQPQQNYAPANQAPPMQQRSAAPNFNDFDDDIPFS